MNKVIGLKFEQIKKEMQKLADVETKLPVRGTSNAMAYDFFAKKTVTAKPGETVKVWTDVKAIMPEGIALILAPRSSMGGKWMLTNTVGFIDGDYANNENNDGNIGFFLKNISEEDLTIEAGDRCGQGTFVPYYITEDDTPLNDTRKGGFGSTGK